MNVHECTDIQLLGGIWSKCVHCFWDRCGQGRIYTWAKGARAQGGILKKNQEGSMVCGGNKAVSE
jgi:hypothetical protein